MTGDELEDKPERHFHKEQKIAFPYLVDGKHHLKVMLKTDFGDINSCDINSGQKMMTNFASKREIDRFLP